MVSLSSTQNFLYPKFEYSIYTNSKGDDDFEALTSIRPAHFRIMWCIVDIRGPLESEVFWYTLNLCLQAKLITEEFHI